MILAKKLITFAEPLCTEKTPTDIRIGLGYTFIELADGKCGLAWTPNTRYASSCTHLKKAGNIQDLTENELLQLLDSSLDLERAIGLATFNAINSRVLRTYDDRETISLLDIKNTDHVVMVGHFAPLISRIQASRCRLEILDLDNSKPGIIDLRQGPVSLSQCDVAIITSTTIITNTVDEIISCLTQSRSAVMLGPSTPVCPEVFKTTGITQVSGAEILNPAKVRSIISQGGGTMLLKRYLRFISQTCK